MPEERARPPESLLKGSVHGPRRLRRLPHEPGGSGHLLRGPSFRAPHHGRGHGRVLRCFRYPRLPAVHPPGGLSRGRRAREGRPRGLSDFHHWRPEARHPPGHDHQVGYAVSPEGRLPPLHAQGNLRAAPRHCRRPHRQGGSGGRQRAPARARQPQRAGKASYRCLRHVLSRWALGPLPHRELGADSRSGGDRLRVQVPRQASSRKKGHGPRHQPER